MRWATRASIHIDRASSAWLIRRFIDPEAEFIFVDDIEDAPADAIPLVMRGLSMTHDDHTVLAISGPGFDGLFEYYRRSVLLGEDVPT